MSHPLLSAKSVLKVMSNLPQGILGKVKANTPQPTEPHRFCGSSESPCCHFSTVCPLRPLSSLLHDLSILLIFLACPHTHHFSRYPPPDAGIFFPKAHWQPGSFTIVTLNTLAPHPKDFVVLRFFPLGRPQVLCINFISTNTENPRRPSNTARYCSWPWVLCTGLGGNLPPLLLPTLPSFMIIVCNRFLSISWKPPSTFYWAHFACFWLIALLLFLPHQASEVSGSNKAICIMSFITNTPAPLFGMFIFRQHSLMICYIDILQNNLFS